MIQNNKLLIFSNCNFATLHNDLVGVYFLFCRFLSRLILIDTTRSRRYYFVCNTWLATDIGDGLVDRTYAKATKKELHELEHLFFTHTGT